MIFIGTIDKIIRISVEIFLRLTINLILIDIFIFKFPKFRNICIAFAFSKNGHLRCVLNNLRGARNEIFFGHIIGQQVAVLYLPNVPIGDGTDVLKKLRVFLICFLVFILAFDLTSDFLSEEYPFIYSMLDLLIAPMGLFLAFSLHLSVFVSQ